MTIDETGSSRLRYFVPMAIIAAASVLAFGLLPRQMSGLVSFVTVVQLVLISRLVAASVDMRPRGPKAVAHLVALGFVYIGSLALVATVLHDVIWATVIFACAVFVTVSVGAWIQGTLRTSASVSRPAP